MKNQRLFFILLLFVFMVNYQDLNARGKILTDSPFYTTFDKIRYTVYTDVDSSEYFAVELIDAAGKPWIRQKLSARNRRFFGVMTLDSHIPSGLFWIRVYPAAFNAVEGPVMYYPLVIINSDDLQQEEWKASLVGISGTKDIHVIYFSGGGDNPCDSAKLAVVDQAGKIIGGAGYYTVGSRGNRFPVMNDRNGLFTVAFSNSGEGNYFVKIGTSPGDSVRINLYPDGHEVNDLKIIDTGMPDESPFRIKLLEVRNTYKRNQDVSLDIEGEEAGDRYMDSSFIFSAGKALLSDDSFTGHSTLLICRVNGTVTHALPEDGTPNNRFCLRGKYINLETGRPRVNYTVALAGLGQEPWMSFVRIDQEGKFAVDASAWPENANIYVSTISSPLKGFSWYDDFFREFPESPAVYFDRKDAAALDTFANEAKIRRVLYYQYYEKRSAGALYSEQVLYDTTRIYPKADLSYDLNDYVPFADIPDVILNILNNVHLVASKKHGDRLFIYNNQNTSLNRNPLFLINGIPTFDLSLVLGLHIRDIQKIDILYDQETLKPFGFAGLGGVMAVYTAQKVDIPNSRKISFQGLHKAEPEYMPPSQEGLPDFSPVLYWNPLMILKDGSGNVRFRLNNLLGSMKVNLTGFDDRGRIIQTTATIKVEK